MINTLFISCVDSSRKCDFSLMFLYSHDQPYKHICMQNHNNNTIKTSDTVLLKNIPLTLFERVRKDCERFYCVRGELEAEQNCNILTPTLMAITVFLSHCPGLLNRGPGGPASLGRGPNSSIFSNCLTSCLHPGYIIVRPSPSSCGRHKSHSIQPVHGQGYILIFFDRMHLLFKQVHFLFWQLGRVNMLQCY